MKPKTVTILIIILCLLAGTGILLVRTESPDHSKGIMGKYLLGDLPANEISSITMKGPDASVILKKTGDQWVVANRFNYPAEFSKIADFVRKLKEAKIGRHFESSEDILKRLSLKDVDDPDAAEQEKGTRILFKDKSEKLLASLLSGKARKPVGEDGFSDGHYVKLSEDPGIYLIDNNFDHLEIRPSAWLEKSLVQVKENDVEKIICLSVDGKKQRYLLERPGKEKDMLLSGLPPDRKLNQSVLNQLSNALDGPRIEDIKDTSADTVSNGPEFAFRIEYHLFNGMIYRVYPGKECSKDNPCHMKLEVAYHKPVSPEKGQAEEQTSKKGGTEKPPEELALKERQLNDRFSPWIFVIPEWRHKNYITDLDQLLEKP